MSPEPVKRVVVGTDFSEGAERALTVAIRFARLLGATIDLVRVYAMPSVGAVSPLPGIVPRTPPSPEILADLQRGLDHLALKVRESGIDCFTVSLQGSAADQIVAHAKLVAAELIVMGTHGRTGIRRVLLGSVAEQVLHKAQCPVLVVPPARDAAS